MSEEDIAYIQDLIDYDDKVIGWGQRIMGKCYPLENSHISRIRAATQKRIDEIKANYGLIPYSC